MHVEAVPLRQLVVMAAVRLTVCSCVCVSWERVDRQYSSVNREQASMVHVMDSLPYLNLHMFIHAHLSTF